MKTTNKKLNKDNVCYLLDVAVRYSLLTRYKREVLAETSKQLDNECRELLIDAQHLWGVWENSKLVTNSPEIVEELTNIQNNIYTLSKQQVAMISFWTTIPLNLSYSLPSDEALEKVSVFVDNLLTALFDCIIKTYENKLGFDAIVSIGMEETNKTLLSKLEACLCRRIDR